MPTTRQILEGLTLISNEARSLAIAWHVATGIFMGGVLSGWKPSPRPAVVVLALLLLSASAMAWAFRNPFNGAVLLVLSVVLAVQGWRLRGTTLKIGTRWAVAVGVAVIGFAWIYPHFVRTLSPVEYLYASPLGLIPCPTLSLESRGWTLPLIGTSVFYGLFGWLRLGVRLDIVLMVGAAALLLRHILRRSGAAQSGTTMS